MRKVSISNLCVKRLSLLDENQIILIGLYYDEDDNIRIY